MKIIGIKELQTNPDKFSLCFNNDECTLITRSGTVIGLTLAFNDAFLEHGLKPWLALEAFEQGGLSLGQLADTLSKNKAETMQMLAQLNIPIADYDLQEDLDAVEKLLSLSE